MSAQRRSEMRIILTMVMMAMVVWGQDAAEADSIKEAKRIWELAVKAKGGREKLHAVRNMVITYTDSEAEHVLVRKKRELMASKKKYKNTSVDFYLLPDKWWYWYDNRPSIWGLHMEMKNYETMKKYIVSDGGPFIDIKTWKPKERGIVEDIDPKEASDDQDMLILIYKLLETKWVQPKIEKLTSGKVGRKKVNVIQTRIYNDRLDFMFDKVTHLLLRAVYYSKWGFAHGERYEDYVDVDGIMLPTEVIVESPHFGESTHYRTYQINVEYNENLFKKPPLPIEEAMDAWKKDWKPSTNEKEKK